MQTLLVTGAAGQLGQRVITHLLESQKVAPGRIVAGTRHPEKLSGLAGKGIQVRRLDFENPNTFASALAGVDRMLLISTDAIDRPGRRLNQHKAAVDAARNAGIRHIVYTSMSNPDDSLIPFAPDHLGTEQALAASGLGWTILRNSWYMDGWLTSLPAVLATGKWYTSAGEGRSARVSREDCARAAAAALASQNDANVRFDITGPQAHTTEEVAATVSEVMGKAIEVIQISDQQLKLGMLAAGLPEWVAELMVATDANTRAGKFDVLSDSVARLTGMPPKTFAAFLTEHKAAVSV